MKHPWLSGILTGAVVAVIAIVFTENIHAQGGRSATGGRIACVDLGVAFNEYQRTKDLEEEIAKLREQLQTEEQQRRQQLDARMAEIDRLAMDDPTRRDRLKELFDMQVELGVWAEAKAAHLARETAIWYIRTYEEVVAKTTEIAERDGYDMVFYKDQFEPISMELEAIKQQMRMNKLLYAHPSVDLTQTVLDKLNADYRAQPRTDMLYVP